MLGCKFKRVYRGYLGVTWGCMGFRASPDRELHEKDFDIMGSTLGSPGPPFSYYMRLQWQAGAQTKNASKMLLV